MNKGDKARVINDCEVKAGSEVEVIKMTTYTGMNVLGGYVAYDCYCNGIRVEIAESNLEVIKAKRWLPSSGDVFWYPNLGTSVFSRWGIWETERDVLQRRFTGVYRTKEESDAMLAKIQALVTSEIGDC